MIRSFADRQTADLWRTGSARRLPGDVLRVALRKLLQIDAAVRLDELATPPGNRLEALRGTLAGRHSVRINDQWRIVFRWEDGHANQVAICDYH